MPDLINPYSHYRQNVSYDGVHTYKSFGIFCVPDL
jgi:hypothetical protein